MSSGALCFSITFARWRRRSEATVSPRTGLIFIIINNLSAGLLRVEFDENFGSSKACYKKQLSRQGILVWDNR